MAWDDDADIEEMRQAALEEAVEQLRGYDTIQPGDVTKEDIAEATGMSTSTIYRRMKPLIDAGRYAHVWVSDANNRKKVYRKIPKEK